MGKNLGLGQHALGKEIHGQNSRLAVPFKQTNHMLEDVHGNDILRHGPDSVNSQVQISLPRVSCPTMLIVHQWRSWKAMANIVFARIVGPISFSAKCIGFPGGFARDQGKSIHV